MPDPEQNEALMIAVLAVSAWPPAKVVDALPALRAAGLTDPERVAGMDLGQLTVELAKNGYHRGLPTSMYAERWLAMARAISDGTMEPILRLVGQGKQSDFMKAIRSIYGVGPRVAENAWALLASRVRWP